MATGGTIQYGIKFNVDNSSLNQLRQELKAMQDIGLTEFKGLDPKNAQATAQELIKIKQSAKDLETILTNAFNIRLNTTN
jgi:hypothetical protein